MSSSDRCVVDTGVLLYFFLADEDALLCDLLGKPFWVPRSVYDPEEPELADLTPHQVPLLSEMRRSIDYYDRSSKRGQCSGHLADRLRRIDQLHDDGRLAVVDLSDEELVLAARLGSRQYIKDYGPASPLGAGEAACVAVAHYRGWMIATDDTDALTALRALQPRTRPPYERIRKLLMRGATSGLITRDRANKVHAEMVRLGFWDKGRPFDK